MANRALLASAPGHGGGSYIRYHPPAYAGGSDRHASRLIRSGLLRLVLLMICTATAHAQRCPDPVPQTSGSHSFRLQGESFEIPISLADCQPVALELRWSNGRNNGSNFNVTFLDGDNQVIYTKELSGFLSGNFQFPFTTLETQQWLRAGSTMLVASIPTTVTIQAVRPFAFPATISYRVTRVAGRQRPADPVVAAEKNPVSGLGSKSSKHDSGGVEGKARQRGNGVIEERGTGKGEKGNG